MSRVYSISGDNGCGKSTFALSGEGVKHYYEFDIGSFERAAIGLELTEAEVDLKQYRVPLTALTGPGTISVGQTGVAPTPARHMEGWTELWWQFVADYLADLKTDGYPVIDTSTKLWLTVRQGFLQEVQTALLSANKTEAERLGTLQYTEPNARMDQVVEASKSYSKDLILIAHEKEVYIGDKPQGYFVQDSYKGIPNAADVCLRFTIRDHKPLATVTKTGGASLALVGLEIPEPTIPLVNQIVEAAAGLRRKGVDVVGESVEAILKLAERML